MGEIRQLDAREELRKSEFNQELSTSDYLSLMGQNRMRWSFVALCASKEKKWDERFFERRDVLRGTDFVNANDDNRVFASTVLFKSKQRSLNNIAQIRKIVLDLDIYQSSRLKKITPLDVFKEIYRDYFYTGLVPTPNIVTFSGKGIYLEWVLEFTPASALQKRNAVVNVLFNIFKDYHPDEKSKDATHVFGVPGSTNWKYGEGSIVRSFRNDLPEYTLADFARRLPKLWEVEAPKKTTPKIRTSSPSKVSRIGLGRNINDSQMDAIIDLIKLRVGRMSGYRERALFFFRNAYHKNEETRFYAGDKTLFEESLREVEKINEMFDEPLGAQEVRRWTLTTHTLYHITTAEMVEWFDITMDEQVQIRLKTRKAKLEKERRRSKRNRAAQGATNNEKLYEAIITAIKSNPTMKDYQVAKLVKSIVGKCSEKTVKKVRESL